MTSIIQCSPIYNQYFPENRAAQDVDWNQFKSSGSALKSRLSKLPDDFSIQDVRTWKDTAKKIALIVLKTIIFIWGFYEVLKYVVQRLVMIGLFPAQSRIVRFFAKKYIQITPGQLDEVRFKNAKYLEEEGFIVRHVSLNRNGTRYSGLLIGHKDTISNGKWTLQATGNVEPIEHSALQMATIYKDFQFNTLLINGPAVGRSEGHANPKSMGEAQEIGIQFLETAVKANKIVIAGRSLGGAAIGQALLEHDFKADVDYLVIRQMTFDKASNICGEIVGRVVSQWFNGLVKKIVKWSGCEMDSVKSSRRLAELGIQEVIVQASNKMTTQLIGDPSYYKENELLSSEEVPSDSDFRDDGPILAQASLGYRLVKEKILAHKIFLCLQYAHHMTDEAISAPKKEILSF